jgi:hypothetical protein
LFGLNLEGGMHKTEWGLLPWGVEPWSYLGLGDKLQEEFKVRLDEYYQDRGNSDDHTKRTILSQE